MQQVLKNFLILCCMIFVLGACTSSNRDSFVPSWHTGVGGVSTAFLSSVPSSVKENSEFGVGLTIENVGATDIRTGQYILSSDDPLVQSEQKSRSVFSLKGRSLYNDKGDEITRIHKFVTGELPDNSKSRSVALRLTYCYGYSTEASAIVCIDADPIGKGRKPCSVSSVSLGGGQGAPVAVASITPSMTQGADASTIVPSFEIQLSNVGDGYVFASNAVSDMCGPSSPNPDDVGTVEVRATLGDVPLVCDATVVNLVKDSTITCSLQQGVRREVGTYSSPITVSIDYGYMSTITRSVTVIK